MGGIRESFPSRIFGFRVEEPFWGVAVFFEVQKKTEAAANPWGSRASGTGQQKKCAFGDKSRSGYRAADSTLKNPSRFKVTVVTITGGKIRT